MLVYTNRFGPQAIRYNTRGDLDRVIEHTGPDYLFLFWSQQELDFFHAYCLLKGKHFRFARLWKDRPWVETKQHDYIWLFVTIPAAKPKPRLP